MEVNQLRYFMAVAKTGSFSKAAGECYISQPALSEQIHKLESDLGKPLFDRSHRKIAPTVAGRLLMEHASRILEQIRVAKILVQGSNGIASGTVAMGILPTIAPYFVPHILRTFSEDFPRIQVMIHEDLTAHLLNMVGGASWISELRAGLLRKTLLKSKNCSPKKCWWLFPAGIHWPKSQQLERKIWVQKHSF